eukprot:m.28348 g.28348  ORF g.28348 m.28348 type:complete len:78 (+) comp30711_c0_seq2:75-308(+)
MLHFFESLKDRHYTLSNKVGIRHLVNCGNAVFQVTSALIRPVQNDIVTSKGSNEQPQDQLQTSDKPRGKLTQQRGKH